MTVEDRATSQISPETVQSTVDSLHIYLPGIMGTNQGMREVYDQVQQVVTEHFPNARFEGKNSYISPDTLKLPDRDRHILLARKIVAALRDNQEVHLYGHSLGAIELSQVMGLVRKMRPDLKDGHPDLHKLHITLMSPAGFGKNLRQTAEMISRVKNIVFAGSERSGHIYGLETLAYLPLKDKGSDKNASAFMSSPEMAGLITRFHLAESQRGNFGQAGETANEIPFVYQQHQLEVTSQRFAHLTDDEKQTLHDVDSAIWMHAEQGNEAAVREDLRRRGKLLSKYVQETYNGHPLEDEQTAEAADSATWRLYAQALLGVGRLLGGMLVGKTYRELKPLHEAGVDIAFLVPEYDALVKMGEILEFMGEDAVEKKAVLLKTTTHSSSSIAPKTLADALRKLQEIRKS